MYSDLLRMNKIWWGAAGIWTQGWTWLTEEGQGAEGFDRAALKELHGRIRAEAEGANASCASCASGGCRHHGCR